LNNRSALLDLRPGLRLLQAAVSFEAVFILYIVSVNYKTDARFAWLPIDLTVVFFALGVVMGAVIIYREGIYLPGLTVVSLFVVFIAWAMITILWTPSKIYAPRKLLELATLALWSIVATAMIIASRPERVRRFLLLLLVFGTVASVDGIIQYRTTGPLAGSASFRLENYISQARFYGMAALVAFAAWLHTSPFSKRGVALMAAFVICCYGLLISGGRGPILGVLAGMLLPLALGLRVADRRLVASKALVASVALFVLMAIAVGQVAAEYSENLRALNRFETLFRKEEGGQTVRLGYWGAAWHLWLQQPVLGSGIGSWPIRYFGLDLGRHPHNLILEVLVEFGLIGLLLLSAVAIAGTRHVSVRRLREHPLLMCAAMLCISMFLSAMTSSDITGNRNVFAMLGLLVMRPYGRSPQVSVQSRARDLGAPGPRHSDLHQAMPNSRRGRL
jgi:O-antigen ligase